MDLHGLPPETGFQTGARGILPHRSTLVLIHGAGGHGLNFLYQLRRLDRTMNVLALDLPGHGATTGPGRETVKDYADWIEETLAGFPFPTFFLGGHSLGGAVALELALRPWPRIRGLILIASGARLGRSGKLLQGLAHDPEPTLKAINRLCFSPEADPRLVQQSLDLLKRVPIQILADDFLAGSRFDRSEDLTAIEVPTLILVGDQDRITPPDLSVALQRKIRQAQLKLIPQAGHLVMVEKPREVNQALRAFLAEHSPPEPPLTPAGSILQIEPRDGRRPTRPAPAGGAVREPHL